MGGPRGTKPLDDPSFQEGRNPKIDRAIDNFVNAREEHAATKETLLKRRDKLVETLHRELPDNVLEYSYGGRHAALSTTETVRASTDKDPE